MKGFKSILVILLLLAMMVMAWYVGFKSSWIETKQEASVDIVLEKVQRVFKLVTVEGHISEIYDYKDYKNWDIALFRKKALIRVNAKVMVGYDFEKVKFTTDEISHTIYIDNFPEAEILSLEHDLDYYDITQSAFNQFSPADYNRINRDVKDFALKKAIESELMEAAKEQKTEIMEMLTILLEASGWKIEVRSEVDQLLN